MSKNLGNLSKIINYSKWQEIQDTIAQATGLAIITIDYKGIPITVHSECREFCSFIRNDPSLSKQCQKCDSRGGLEAVRLNGSYMYRCHYNLVDLAVPIIADNKYLGAVMAGQVKLTNLPNHYDLEQIVAPKISYDILSKKPELYFAYEKIPYLSYHQFVKYANLISSITNYAISEGIEKVMLKDSVTPEDDNTLEIKNIVTPPPEKYYYSRYPKLLFFQGDYRTRSHICSRTSKYFFIFQRCCAFV